MKKLSIFLLAVVFAISALAGCASGNTNETPATTTDAQTVTEAPEDSEADNGEKFLIGFSTDTTTSAWRSKMVLEMEKAVEANSDKLELITTVAEDDTNKQISDIEDLVTRGIDLLIVSPHVADPLTPIVREVYESGIPVIVVDREVSGDAFTTFIGASNVLIGEAAGKIIAEELNGKGNVIELQGTAGASPTIGRGEPMRAILEEYPDIKLIASQNCDYDEMTALETMENLLQVHGPGEIDLIYAHADNMALGAMKAIDAAGRSEDGIRIIGIDAQKQAFEAIMNGTFVGTFTYPWPSEKAIEIALKILNGEEVEKRYDLDTVFVDSSNVDQFYDPDSEY